VALKAPAIVLELPFKVAAQLIVERPRRLSGKVTIEKAGVVEPEVRYPDIGVPEAVAQAPETIRPPLAIIVFSLIRDSPVAGSRRATMRRVAAGDKPATARAEP
jgi:hypothetical protein